MATESQISEVLSSLPCHERHFCVREIAQMWRLSDNIVRRIFEAEPGVLSIGEARSTGRRRRYLTLRIPQAVLERVHSRLQGGGQ